MTHNFKIESIFRIILGAVISVFSNSQLTAQQVSLFNTYSYDPLQINIAYAGFNCTEVNMHYRTQWIGLKDSPKLIQLNAHSTFRKSSGLALKINSLQSGLINSIQTTLGYAHKVKLSGKSTIQLGLGIGYVQNIFNGQKAIVIDDGDGTLRNQSLQKTNGLDGEMGAMYISSKLKIGLGVLHVFNTNPKFSTSTYKVLPQINLSASYLFNEGKNVEVEPWLLNRYTVNGSNVFEGIMNVHLNRELTVGAGYRAGYGMLALLGIKVGKIKIAYSYDYSASKNSFAFGSSHQISLGIKFCKNTEVNLESIDKTPAILNVLGSEKSKEEQTK